MAIAVVLNVTVNRDKLHRKKNNVCARYGSSALRVSVFRPNFAVTTFAALCDKQH